MSLTLPRSTAAIATRKRSFRRELQSHGSIDSNLAEQLWHDPEAVLGSGTKLQEKARGRVVRLQTANARYLLKHQVWGDRTRRLKKAFSVSAARREWEFGRQLLAAGIPTPRPLALVEERLGPMCFGSYYLSEFVAGDSLYRCLRFAKPAQSVIDSLAEQFARIWQQLDLMSISHGDLKTENLMVDPAGELWLIDLEKARSHRRADRLRCRQTRDLADLLHSRNWRSDPMAAERFRLALLQTPAAEMLLRASRDPRHPLRLPRTRGNDPDELVTVLIVAFNAAATLASCVESVREMADEIVVADLGSSDGTQQLVQGMQGCRLVELPGHSIIAAMEDLRREAAFPWVMHLFAHERLNPALSRQIQDRLASGTQALGFRIPRSSDLRVKAWRDTGRLPSSIRLYRRDAGKYEWQAGQLVINLPEPNLGKLTSKIVVGPLAASPLTTVGDNSLSGATTLPPWELDHAA